jgi:hypothetical protein
MKGQLDRVVDVFVTGDTRFSLLLLLFILIVLNRETLDADWWLVLMFFRPAVMQSNFFLTFSISFWYPVFILLYMAVF